jgi:hypothetical protein
MDFQGVGCGGIYCYDVAQDTNRSYVINCT